MRSIVFRSLLAISTTLLLTAALACVESSGSNQNNECDPADNASCVCLDDVTGTECIGPDANNCTCAVPRDDSNNDDVVDNNDVDLPTDEEVIPSPTSINFDRSQPDGSPEYHAWLCLEDNNNPFAGFSIEATYPAQCGDANVVLGLTVLGADTGLAYVATSGVFSIASASAGEQGEGPYRGTSAWRLSTTGTTSMVLQSVVLRQDTYTIAFDLVLSLDGTTPKMEIAKIDVTRNP